MKVIVVSMENEKKKCGCWAVLKRGIRGACHPLYFLSFFIVTLKNSLVSCHPLSNALFESFPAM